MLLHHNSDSGILSMEAGCRRREIFCNLPSASPILLNSKPQQHQRSAATEEEERRICHTPTSDEDLIEIKELSQSPRASRCSMFSFSPTPESSPISQCKDLLSDDSPISSPESTLGPMATNNSYDSPPHSDRRRYMIINELIATESKYIENLNTILTVFLPAFEHVVAPRDLRVMIPAQLEMLVENHNSILSSLKQRLSSETQYYGFVGDIFSRLCSHSNMEFFNMYRVYMGEFKMAMRTLSNYQKESPQFKGILALIQQTPFCERLSLASYLLTPIQRLPRYELLLKELLKHTPLDHPDHYYIGEALGRLHKELTRLNLSIKSCQMACPAVQRKSSFKIGSGSNVRRKATRKASRTLSVLKRFVSAASIDDYSSGGELSFTDDMVKAPRMPRRRRAGANSSHHGSDFDLSLSMPADSSSPANTSFFRRNTLTATQNRAVSCSDLLLEFEERKPHNFHLLTPLASEACTPESSRRSSVDHSFFYSSNSSLSSLDSSKLEMKEKDREDSLTPTDTPSRLFQPMSFSTPQTEAGPDQDESKDSTLKGDSQYAIQEEPVASDNITKQPTKKNTWKNALGLFKRNRKSHGHSVDKKRSSPSGRELKYIKWT